MCGIVGYVGSQPALDIVMAGLKRLEYRGYDSAGVAVLADGGLADVCGALREQLFMAMGGCCRPLDGVDGFCRQRPCCGPECFVAHIFSIQRLVVRTATSVAYRLRLSASANGWPLT